MPSSSEPTALGALEDALDKLSAAERALARAAEELSELGEDLCTDAVRRLQERGASEAQVESYQDGWHQRRNQLRDQVASVRSARDGLTDAVARVRALHASS